MRELGAGAFAAGLALAAALFPAQIALVRGIVHFHGGGVRRVKKPPLQAGAGSSLCQCGQTYFSGTCARVYGSRTSSPGNIR